MFLPRQLTAPIPIFLSVLALSTPISAPPCLGASCYIDPSFHRFLILRQYSTHHHFHPSAVLQQKRFNGQGNGPDRRYVGRGIHSNGQPKRLTFEQTTYWLLKTKIGGCRLASVSENSPINFRIRRSKLRSCRPSRG